MKMVGSRFYSSIAQGFSWLDYGNANFSIKLLHFRKKIVTGSEFLKVRQNDNKVRQNSRHISFKEEK